MDTMTWTKIIGAGCGSLLILILHQIFSQTELKCHEQKILS